MPHMISSGESQTWGQPPIHVNTPMSLFRHNQVDRPANEDTRKNSPQSDPGS
jgi:hypothetical protein